MPHMNSINKTKTFADADCDMDDLSFNRSRINPFFMNDDEESKIENNQNNKSNLDHTDIKKNQSKFIVSGDISGPIKDFIMKNE